MVISVEQLVSLCGRSDIEVALIDVREFDDFIHGHISIASNVPFGQLELRIFDLVPRRSVAVVLCDRKCDLTARAANTLTALGYSDVNILSGGIDAWKAAGHPLFVDANVPSKAFGEYVEHIFNTPSISADEVFRRKRSGANQIIVDCRTPLEHCQYRVPGAVFVPSADLLTVVPTLVRDSETDVIVQCGGRTRSILGAQSLIISDLPNRVYALEDGAAGWHIAGYRLDCGRPIGIQSNRIADYARVRIDDAQRNAERFGVKLIDEQTYSRYLTERHARSLHVFDLRAEAQFRLGHLHGASCVLGGQLLQATDDYIATRNARIVLADDDSTRPLIVGFWLKQLGWTDTVALDLSLMSGELSEAGSTMLKTDSSLPTEKLLGPDQLRGLLASKRVSVVDLTDSREFRKGHIPGAWWATRADLASQLDLLPDSEHVVLTSTDGRAAKFACLDLTTAKTPVLILEGGTNAWISAGLALEHGPTRVLRHTPLLSPESSLPDELAQALVDWGLETYAGEAASAIAIEDLMAKYLKWEKDLLNAIRHDPVMRFSSPSGVVPRGTNA